VLRVVLDTNIFVSSLLVKEGLSAQVLDAWRERKFLLATSPTLVSEIQSTLNYPRIRRKYNITNKDVSQLITLLAEDALVVPGDIETASGSVPDDPADEAVLACALDAEADLVVSGDRHLLDLAEYRGIRILTVREFMEKLSAENQS
jgi:putative PIN family toxin of toxin-antitoxin system